MTQNPSYNILDEPWIPVKYLNGSWSEVKEISLKTLIEHANEIESVITENPLDTYAIYRFIFTYVMDILQPDYDMVSNLYTKGRFEQNELRMISDYNAENYSRFDVFDSAHPFYQSADFGEKENADTIMNLFQYLPSKNGSIFFFHTTKDSIKVSVEICVRGLLAHVCFFSLGGAGYSPNINGSAPYYGIVRGKNLYETIILNLCGINIQENTGNERSPCWLDDRSYSDEAFVRANSVSTLEGLTFLCRKIKLIPCSDVSADERCTITGRKSKYFINQTYFSPGRKLTGSWIDPYSPYIIINNENKPLRPEKGRAIWRDIGPLLICKQYESGNIRYFKPRIFQQLDEMIEDRTFESTELSFEIFVLEAQPGKSKFFGYAHQTLNINELILKRENNLDMIMNTLNFATKADDWIKKGVEKVSKSKGLSLDASITFWSSIENIFKDEFLNGLIEFPETASFDDYNNFYNEFCENKIMRIGLSILRKYINDFDNDIKLIEKQIKAEDEYQSELHNFLYPTAAKKSSAAANADTSAESSTPAVKKTGRAKKSSAAANADTGAEPSTPAVKKTGRAKKSSAAANADTSAESSTPTVKKTGRAKKSSAAANADTSAESSTPTVKKTGRAKKPSA